MPTDVPVLLADLGGTRLRLAQRSAKGPENIREYTPGEWESFQAAVRDYAQDTAGSALFMSFAKKVNAGGVYALDQAHKKGAWSFRIDDIKRDLNLNSMQVLHDMQAMGRAVFNPDAFTRIGGGAGGQGWRLIINVGTGLGHAFVNPENKGVLDTFGGHFPPAAVTHEQREALHLLQSSFSEQRTFIWEEILSGRGIERLDAQTMDGARVFCEFLGIYANTLAVGMDAFGGIYFCGGVMDHLFAENLFNTDAFLKFFVLDNVPIVDQSLRACPVYRASLPHTALYGLDVYAQSLSHY